MRGRPREIDHSETLTVHRAFNFVCALFDYIILWENLWERHNQALCVFPKALPLDDVIKKSWQPHLPFSIASFTFIVLLLLLMLLCSLLLILFGPITTCLNISSTNSDCRVLVFTVSIFDGADMWMVDSIFVNQYIFIHFQIFLKMVIHVTVQGMCLLSKAMQYCLIPGWIPCCKYCTILAIVMQGLNFSIG